MQVRLGLLPVALFADSRTLLRAGAAGAAAARGDDASDGSITPPLVVHDTLKALPARPLEQGRVCHDCCGALSLHLAASQTQGSMGKRVRLQTLGLWRSPASDAPRRLVQEPERFLTWDPVPPAPLRGARTLEAARSPVLGRARPRR